MSKQEHDQDGQRASSGAGKGKGNADEASKRPADSPATSGHSASAPPGGEQPAAASTVGDDKSAAPKQDAPATQTPSGSSASPHSDDASGKRPAAGAAQGADSGKGGNKGKNKGGAAGDASAGPGDAKPRAASSSSTSSGDKPTDSRDSAKSASANGSPKPSGGGSGVKPPGGNGRGGKAGGIALALVILLALAVLLGGWWGWQKFQSQQQRLAQAESNAQAISQLESRLESQIGDDNQQRQQAIQALRNDFQQYREEMNATLDKVLKQLASKQQTDSSEWRLAEVQYLLRLANQRLQLERDVKGAMSLLQTADQRLAQIDNPALTPVRRAIQSEIAALDSVPQVDRTGLYLELMAQQEQLATLPLEQDVQQQAAEAGDASPMQGGWKQQLSRFGQELKDLVVVRKHDQALEALMTPEQESYLRQNVRLQLEQAQLALLQGNAKLYRASLDKARTLIKRYYDTDDQGVANSLERLATLADKNVHPELPEISDSLQQLRDFMERRHDAGSDAA